MNVRFGIHRSGRAQVPVVVVDHVCLQNFHGATPFGGLIAGKLSVVEHQVTRLDEPLTIRTLRGDVFETERLGHFVWNGGILFERLAAFADER